MPIETVCVQYVNEPREGKKQGSIKTDDGRYFNVWPEKLELYTAGMTYEIEYDAKFKTVKRIISEGGTASTPSVASVTHGQASHVPSYATTSSGSTKPVEMFVMGVIGRCLEGQGIIPDKQDLTLWVRNLRTAWAEGFSDEPIEVERDGPEPGLDDKVPF